MTKKEIGAKLKELRLRDGKTQLEIAEELGMTRQHITNFENGDRGFSIEKINKIFALYDLEIKLVLKNVKTKNNLK